LLNIYSKAQNKEEKMDVKLRLISADELKNMLGGVSASTFWRLRKHGELPAGVRIGRREYWEEHELIEWFSSKKRK
jgi:predicted DNA-binding transcriptional regulator AlpA